MRTPQTHSSKQQQNRFINKINVLNEIVDFTNNNNNSFNQNEMDSQTKT
tara:strand:- start:1387 stop:1533 length:147 start_codon:yes stop_codon:yes gene_type:complete